MLRQEEYFVKKFMVAGYPTLGPEFLNASERVAWGWRNVLYSMLMNKKFSERWQPYMRAELGMCAATNNNLAFPVRPAGDFEFAIFNYLS
jgi:hypothetical protein